MSNTSQRRAILATVLLAAFLFAAFGFVVSGMLTGPAFQAQAGLAWNKAAFSVGREAAVALKADALLAKVAKRVEMPVDALRKQVWAEPEPFTSLVMVRCVADSEAEALHILSNLVFVASALPAAESDNLNDGDMETVQAVSAELESVRQEHRLLVRSVGVQKATSELLQSRRRALERELIQVRSEFEKSALTNQIARIVNDQILLENDVEQLTEVSANLAMLEDRLAAMDSAVIEALLARAEAQPFMILLEPEAVN